MTQTSISPSHIDANSIDDIKPLRDTENPCLVRNRERPRRTSWLLVGSWFLIVLQPLAIVGILIDGHVRDGYIESSMESLNAHNAAGTLGVLLGSTLPSVAALAAALTAYRLKRTPQATRAGFAAGSLIFLMVLLQFTPTSAKANRRDLSTPSARLIGDWVDTRGVHAHYGPLNKIGLGEFTVGCLSGRYRVISEKKWGTHLALEAFVDIGGRSASLSIDVEAAKDGSSMSQEWTTEGSQSLMVFEYVGK